MYLNCHTHFSFKYGIFTPAQLLEESSACGYRSVALTDINNTSGILQFAKLAPSFGIKPVAGIDFRNGMKQQFTGIAKNISGFRELNDFLSSHLYSELSFADHAPEFRECFVVYPLSKNYCTLKENEFIGVTPSLLRHLPFSCWKNRADKLVILGCATFRNKIDYNTHRLLRAIGENLLLSKLPPELHTTEDEIMLRSDVLKNVFEIYPQIIKNTEQIFEECSIDFEFDKPKNRKYFLNSMADDSEKLRALCYENLSYRYPDANYKIKERFENEITTITELGFACYFLINWDIINYARNKNYFYVGRGSGANSMVAYLLRITDVDPVDLDLYFERFINPYRTSPPDFDIDFSWTDRDDLTRYIFDTYGTQHTALLGSYNTFKKDSAIRELGKVFGLPKEEISNLQDQEVVKPSDHISSLVLRYAERIKEFPNHLGIHASGILISQEPIHTYTATNMPPKGFPLTQFSMDEAEDIKLYKFDILSQRGLGHIKDSVKIIQNNYNVEIDIHDVKKFLRDDNIREVLKSARCMGCFYIESPAMRMLLKKLEVSQYLGLVAASSIIRPGVASSGMMREYILRSKNLPATYTTPQAMYDLLAETYGVMVYQEDVIKVAHYFAGLDLGEADMLRRGMSGKYRGREEFLLVKEKFFSNCRDKGYEAETSIEVWRQIESFAGYAFSKGHSASYAVESYQSLFLKTYYPLEHMVAVINNFGGFYQTEYYFHEARMHGATIHAPDINKSDYLTNISGKDIHIGLILIAEFESKVALDILDERAANGIFSNLEDFMRRISLSAEQLRILIRVGAFRFTGKTKKELLWEIYNILGRKNKTETHRELFQLSVKKYTLPELNSYALDDALDQKEILGFSLSSPFNLLRNAPVSKMLATEFPQHAGKEISIAGYLVTVKPTRTRKGERMMFATFIDLQGNFFDTAHFPAVLYAFPLRGKGCYMIHARVAEEFNFFSLDVISIERLENHTHESIVAET